jgi:hypothetical protein
VGRGRHVMYGESLKNLIEMMNEYIKDRVEAFELHCLNVKDNFIYN